MRKMGVYLGLVEGDEHDELVEPRGSASRARSYDTDEPEPRGRRDDRYDYDDEAAYDDEPARPVARSTRPEPAASYAAPAPRFAVDDEPAVEAPRAASAAHRITTLHPRTYNEARAIGEEFRDGNPVIMNLTEMDDADAKRLVDFAAGLTFGLRGSIERVTTKVFLLSPQKVKVTAEDKARIADGRYPSRG